MLYVNTHKAVTFFKKKNVCVHVKFSFAFDWGRRCPFNLKISAFYDTGLAFSLWKKGLIFWPQLSKNPKQPLPRLLRCSSSLQDCEAAFASASRWRHDEVGCCGMPDGHDVTHRVFLPHMPHEEFPNQLPSRYIYPHSTLCMSVNERKSQLPTAARRWTWKAGKR